VQIVEASLLALRTARLSLANATSNIRITLFPMVHIGEPEYFETVYADAFAHDVAIVEALRSPISRRITRSNRWIEGSPALNLVVQPRYPPPGSCRAGIIEADLSGEEFAAVWREVPLWLRALVYVVTPAIGAQRRWFGTRERLAKGLSFDDLTSRDEWLNWDPETAALDRAILHARDVRLLEILNEQLGDPAPDPRRVSVVYGARHMRAVVRELKQTRIYHVERGDWLIVFRL